jgi:hypothetical protein
MPANNMAGSELLRGGFEAGCVGIAGVGSPLGVTGCTAGGVCSAGGVTEDAGLPSGIAETGPCGAPVLGVGAWPRLGAAGPGIVGGFGAPVSALGPKGLFGSGGVTLSGSMTSAP